MSPEFTEILARVDDVVRMQNLAHGAGGVLCLMAILLIKWRSLTFLLVILVPVAAGFVAGDIFQHWWEALNHAAKSPEDQQWIRDHDGGAAIVFFGIMGKAILTWMISGVVYFLRWLLVRILRKRSSPIVRSVS